MQESGIYFLTIRTKRKITLRKAHKKAEISFPSGYFIYVGSAMNGLKSRIKRHIRTFEFKHWHIDELLSKGEIVDIQIRCCDIKEKECEMALFLKSLDFLEPLPGFGASDCKCDTHAFFTKTSPFVSIYSNELLANIHKIFRHLREKYIDHAALSHEPFKTLITCILSLRTKDNVTHEAAERLFAVYKTPKSLASANPSHIAKLIFPVGMYKQKAHRLKKISKIISVQYEGKVPCEIEELICLPGVGRKTANLVRSFAYHLPAVCVDTHVHRITNRWGFVRTLSPEHTEIALRSLLPESYWQEINGFLVQHGQQICLPFRPNCENCFLKQYCKYDQLIKESLLLEEVDSNIKHPSLTLRKPSEHGTRIKEKAISPFENS